MPLTKTIENLKAFHTFCRSFLFLLQIYCINLVKRTVGQSESAVHHLGDAPTGSLEKGFT